jgi:hypothetical protein
MGNLADLVHATGALDLLQPGRPLPFNEEQARLVRELLAAYIRDQRPPMDEPRDERDRLIGALLRELILDQPGKPFAHYLRRLRLLIGRYHPGNPPPTTSPLSHQLAHRLAVTTRHGINLPTDRMIRLVWQRG